MATLRLRRRIPDAHFPRYADEDREWKRAIVDEYVPLIEQYLLEGYRIEAQVRHTNVIWLTAQHDSGGRIYEKEYRRLLPPAKSRHGVHMIRPPRRVARAFARYLRSQGLSTKTTRHIWEET